MTERISLKEYWKLCGDWHYCTCLSGKSIKVEPFRKRKNWRHGLSTTVTELMEIVQELKNELKGEISEYDKIHFELPIVNKDGTSDGWTFERKKR